MDPDGELVVFDPTVREVGPTALLMREDMLRQYLSEEGLELCWVVRGEKLVIGAGSGFKNYGVLNILGAYRYTPQGPQRGFSQG